jgi:glycosyltransferase involved in cell wall biosynthesis
MGSHSGYDLIGKFLKTAGVGTKSIWLKDSPFNRPVTFVIRILRKIGSVQSPWYKARNFRAEIRAIRKCRAGHSILHILYGENNLGLFSSALIKGKVKVVVTVHQPSDWWCRQVRLIERMFDSVDALIVLSGAEQKAFSQLTSAPVHFVPHGIDTDFFTPASHDSIDKKLQRAKPRCLFVGQWLRDFITLHRVIEALSAGEFRAEFDLVIPRHPGMDSKVLSLIEKIEKSPNTTSHRNLDDISLRALYQNANFLVLPLEESTANNSILEALACGLPVITTATSGVGDYVDTDCARDAKDASGIVAAIEELHTDSDLQSRMSEYARRKAISEFSWNCVAEQVATIYRDLEGNVDQVE